jgi:CRP/FNR family cyclic AMP-dependent transcriptional regulator
MRTAGLIEKAFILKKSPLFAGIDLDLLLSLADKATLGRFEAEEIIFGHAQEGSRLYIVAEGRVALTGKEDLFISEIRGTDFFGDEALFNDRPRGYSAVALENVLLVSLSKTHLMGFMNECPAALINLMQIWASRTDLRPR